MDESQGGKWVAGVAGQELCSLGGRGGNKYSQVVQAGMSLERSGTRKRTGLTRKKRIGDT